MIDKITFFNDYWSALEDNGWKGIILHSWQKMPVSIPSDVDYAVSGPRPKELLRFISEYCKERGWSLAQVIEHEPEAYFCLCVQAGGGFQTVALDVTWQYSRLGHKLVDAECLFKERYMPEGKFFYVASCGSELCYILAKAAAKNKKYSEIESRVNYLIEQDPEACLKALKHEFKADIKSNEIASWYETASCFKGVRRGHRYGVNEIMLYLRRIFQPTGFWISLKKCDKDDDIIDALENVLPPLFRQKHRVGKLSFARCFSVMMKIVRTRLVIETGGVFSQKLLGSSSRLIVDCKCEDLNSKEIVFDILQQMSKRMDVRIASMK